MGANATSPKEFRPLGNIEVFNGNSPNPSAWTLLNLSNWVGARFAFVMLNFHADGADAGYAVGGAGFLPKNFPIDAGGCQNVHVELNNNGVICTLTSITGRVYWYCDQVDKATIIYLYMFIA